MENNMNDQQWGGQQYGQQYGNQQYGQPYSANRPQPVRGWSWGAFMFNIPFGFGNKAYLTLLTIAPKTVRRVHGWTMKLRGVE